MYNFIVVYECLDMHFEILVFREEWEYIVIEMLLGREKIHYKLLNGQL
jgi:hypothetical protein